MAALTCMPVEAPDGTMMASTYTTPSSDGPDTRPITNATHKDPFSHALWARPSSRRISDPPSLGPSFPRPSSREVAVDVFDSGSRVDVLAPGVGRCAR